MEYGLVSIIVVSYNHSKYIDTCLDHILNQTYKNWELIIADDFSKDDSIAVFDRWLAKNNKTAVKVYNEWNQGFVRTLNKCLESCKGKYIKLIAADDFLLQTALKDSLRVFDGDNDELGIVYSNCYTCDSESNINYVPFIKKSVDLADGWVHGQLLNGNIVPALTAIIAKRVFDTVGRFDENLWIEDWEFWLRASEKFRFAYVDKPLAVYRIHGGNVSAQSEKMLIGELQIMKKYEDDDAFRLSVNNWYRDKFYNTPYKSFVLDQYASYKHRNEIQYFFMSANLPRKVLRVIQKIFHI